MLPAPSLVAQGAESRDASTCILTMLPPPPETGATERWWDGSGPWLAALEHVDKHGIETTAAVSRPTGDSEEAAKQGRTFSRKEQRVCIRTKDCQRQSQRFGFFLAVNSIPIPKAAMKELESRV